MIIHPAQPERRGKLESGPRSFFDNPSSGSAPPAELMSVADTAAFLNISTTGVRRLQQARQLAFVKVGGSVRFLRADLIAYLARRRVEPIDP